MESAALDPARKTSKKCQIEGCHEITVGSRTALCRKHRNNKYKQNYNKKKKRKAHGSEEMPSESIENQLAEEKCLMEQKYASMLQQVLAQKQLELLQSEKVIQVLRAHQQKVKQDKIKEIQERKIKKEQEPKEAKDQESVVSEVSSLSTEDGVTDKSNSKATKTPKKSHQSKKSAGKAVTSKDARMGNNINFSGNMDTTSKQLVPSSGFVTKTLYTGVNTSPALGMNNGSYISGQNSQAPNGSHQVVPIQPLSMTIQQFPKIDSIFSYQANSLSSVTNTGGYAKICIDNTLKDLSGDPSGSIVTSTVTSSNQLQPSLGAGKEMSSADGNNFVILDSKAMQSVKTRLQQNASYQIMQKVNLPSRNASSQGDHQRELYPSLMAPCTSSPATTGSNLGAVVGMVQQNPGNFPLMNLSQAMSLSNGQITSSGPTPAPQKIQGVMAQSWPNQIMPGRVQAPTMQDDFLLQMLQDSKDTQVQHGAQSQTNSALTSVNHVMTDQSWAMSIGM